MKLSKAKDRDKKDFKKKNGMKVTSKGLFLIQEIQYNRTHDKKGK